MKFSSTLQFNAVPEWRDKYLDYDQLKKLIFRLERANVTAAPTEDTESLVGLDPTVIFSEALDREVEKMDAFYKELETKMAEQCRTVDTKLQEYLGSSEYRDLPGDLPNYTAQPERTQSQRHNQRHRGQQSAGQYEDDEGGDEAAAASDSSDDDAPTTGGIPVRRRSTIHDEVAQKKSISFENVNLRREITSLFVLLNEVLSYSDLNKEGLRKALKKFDKVHGTQLLPQYMQKLKSVRAFSDEASHDIGTQIDRLVAGFAKLTGESEEKSLETLSSLLREHVVYERNTVWRELIGIERQAQGVQSTAGTAQPSHHHHHHHLGSHDRKGLAKLLGPKPLKCILATVVFFLVLIIQPLESVVQSRCLAVVLLASILWATEALPLFVTSMMIPVLVVLLRIPLNDDGHTQMTAKEASAFVFSKMWSPVISILLGGFTLAAALSKYNLAKALAQTIMLKSGTDSPRKIILILMFVAAFLCMWISNVAAPVLLYSVTQPLLRVLPSGDPFSKALILGIALASNIGGTASPIASPQNILALQNMDPEPSWLEWFWVALPTAVLSIVVIWAFLCLVFPVSVDAYHAMSHMKGTGPTNHGGSSQFGMVHVYIMGVTLLTILLWCFSHQLEPWAGDMGILALLPMVLLFGPGILSGADFNNFLWTIVALAMGGIVLGQSVESCGLLANIANSITGKIAHLPLFAICLIFGLMVTVVASFISHTVAALIILPLVKSVGDQLDQPHPRLLVMISALLCSGAMALPTSGFPNVTAICMVDELGQPYLTAADFISKGVPSTLIVYVIIVTLGYLLCTTLGF